MSLHLAKAKIQELATKAWFANNEWGVLAMATGTGKSKIIIDQIKRLAAQFEEGVFVIVVPTRKLRDKNWKEEFEKWDALDIWETRVIKTCYKSLNKLKDLNVLFVGLDECHRMTDLQVGFFENNTIHRCMGVTASMPEDSSYTAMNKQMLFRNLELKVLFTFTLLQALQQKVVAELSEIIVIVHELDNKSPYLKNYKHDRNYYTEFEHYQYLSNQILRQELNSTRSTAHLRNNRAMFLKKLASKALVARNLLPKIAGRFLVFCSNKAQCEYLLKEDVYHSSSGDSGFNKFVNFEIDMLGAVSALNEGHSLPLVDGIFVVDMTSKLRDFIQRLGRTLRFRENFKAKCYILATKDTIEYDWTIKILRQSKLPYKEVKLK